MRIKLEGVPVSDQEHAIRFYTDVLGFQIKQNIDLGNARLVTLVSPDEPEGTELLLEPNGEHAATKAYKEALVAEGIPITAFEVDDTRAEFDRLTGLGVRFTMDPSPMEIPGVGTQVIATFDDTCGNLIMIYDRPKGGTVA